MKRTILVIGANSALARDVIPALRELGTVLTAGRRGCDVYCDVMDLVVIPDGVTVVVNFAASFGGVSDEEIRSAVETNVVGTLKICEAAKKAGVKQLISISSIFTLLDETSPFYSIYAITKKHGDELAQYYCGLNKIPLTILRPSRIYGDSDAFEKNQPFLYQIAQKAEGGEDIVIYGTHDARRNYIHSADLAEIIVRSITQGVQGTYSCVYPESVTYSEIARTAQEVYDHGGQVRFLDNKPDIPDDTFPLDESIYERMEYRPRISIEEGMRRIKKYREGEK